MGLVRRKPVFQGIVLGLLILAVIRLGNVWQSGNDLELLDQLSNLSTMLEEVPSVESQQILEQESMEVVETKEPEEKTPVTNAQTAAQEDVKTNTEANVYESWDFVRHNTSTEMQAPPPWRESNGTSRYSMAYQKVVDRPGFIRSIARPSFIENFDIKLDPLRHQQKKPVAVDYQPQVEYLGVLLDGGRHYFSVDWLENLIDQLAAMKFNLLHLRLTDDPSFNVLLESYPELAFPAPVVNPDQRVWTVPELRHLVRYARERGVAIMPEINVPGHAGAWGGIPHLIVGCPNFFCTKGYGVPLNVTHPDLRTILTEVLREVIDIFENPPFLHLGGDEVSMGGPCMGEVTHESKHSFNYAAFEVLLHDILNDLKYPEGQVVRWEMTGPARMYAPNFCATSAECSSKDRRVRGGGIEHFWESFPRERHAESLPHYFVSRELYFDIAQDQLAWDIFQRANKGAFHLKTGTRPLALIPATFELSVDNWYEKNLLGRLLAASMGSANWNLGSIPEASRETFVIDQYKYYCENLALGSELCQTMGGPLVPDVKYKPQIRDVLYRGGWIKGICDRMTTNKTFRTDVEPFYGEEKRKLLFAESVINTRGETESI